MDEQQRSERDRGLDRLLEAARRHEAEADPAFLARVLADAGQVAADRRWEAPMAADRAARPAPARWRPRLLSLIEDWRAFGAAATATAIAGAWLGYGTIGDAGAIGALPAPFDQIEAVFVSGVEREVGAVDAFFEDG
ncbi:MAG: hypothetical protein AAGE18_09945 [Pseudomonadota bacterium]